MFTTIITDCKSQNAINRQATRVNSLGLGPTTVVGVGSGITSDATIEAAGNLIDALDSAEGRKGVIIVNVAPRGNKKDGENGTPFCYFNFKNTLVISTTGGYTLSFIKKFKVADKVNVFNTKEVLNFAQKKKLITKKQNKHIASSQFRSFDFAPRVAKWILAGTKIPSKLVPVVYQPVPNSIWCIDAFGNAKLTLTTKGLSNKKTKKQIKTSLGTFKYYRRLKDVPKGKTAIFVGSSGIGSKRFLELATQATSGSAAKKLNLKVGSKIEIL